MRAACLALSLILTTATAQAAEPLGCYVSFSNPSQCVQTGHFYCGANWTDNFIAFGFPIAELCQDYLDSYNTLLNCNAYFDEAIAQRNTALDERDALSSALSDANALISKTSFQLGKSAALAKKLRKACGSKCKKIK
jgi:hypothetical protein